MKALSTTMYWSISFETNVYSCVIPLLVDTGSTYKIQQSTSSIEISTDIVTWINDYGLLRVSCKLNLITKYHLHIYCENQFSRQ